jgi:hypothetical protein
VAIADFRFKAQRFLPKSAIGNWQSPIANGRFPPKSVVDGRHLLSSTVDTFRHAYTRFLVFAEVFDNWGIGMAVVHTRATAKGCESPYAYVLAPSNAARGFSRLPFGTPLSQINHLSKR